ncbi:hypothetical protein PG997_011688 [Apiospora hydei]|uniref:Uncharacterized protein n=1 Tax=Apiospora hydei TaxID=1337664 RepID=A0ABR1VJR6_9PEZI
MHFSTAAALLFAAVGTINAFPTNAVDESFDAGFDSYDGFQVPDGTTDGVYSVLVHANGTEELTRVGDGVDPATADAYLHGELGAVEADGDAGPIDAFGRPPELGHALGRRLLQPPEQGPAPARPRRTNSALRPQRLHERHAVAGPAMRRRRPAGGPQAADTAPCTAKQRDEAFSVIAQECGDRIAGSASERRTPEKKKAKQYVSYGYENHCKKEGRGFCGHYHN